MFEYLGFELNQKKAPGQCLRFFFYSIFNGWKRNFSTMKPPSCQKQGLIRLATFSLKNSFARFSTCVNRAAKSLLFSHVGSRFTSFVFRSASCWCLASVLFGIGTQHVSLLTAFSARYIEILKSLPLGMLLNTVACQNFAKILLVTTLLTTRLADLGATVEICHYANRRTHGIILGTRSFGQERSVSYLTPLTHPSFQPNSRLNTEEPSAVWCMTGKQCDLTIAIPSERTRQDARRNRQNPLRVSTPKLGRTNSIFFNSISNSIFQATYRNLFHGYGDDLMGGSRFWETARNCHSNTD